MQHFRYAVVGAGINGRCVARALTKAVGGQNVVLIDQFQPDHIRGSSHGEERITRSSYSSAHWVAAMQRAHAEDWPSLEADVGKTLIHRGGDAVFFGNARGSLPRHAAAVRAIGADVDELDVPTARRRFPAFTFVDCELVLHDRSAGVIAAGDAMRGLLGWLESAGVTLRFGEPVLGIEPGSSGVNVRTPSGKIQAERVAVCAGPWVGQLLPEMSHSVRPTRQDVGFWSMGEGVQVGTFPAWVRLDEEGTHYGLPCIESGLMKAAFHRTGGEQATADPMRDDPGLEMGGRAEPVAHVEDRLRRWFARPVPAVSKIQSCFYTNADDDEFIIRYTDPERRVLAVSACSGHAFKLAPHTAGVVASQLLA